jgi:uncharacterized protein
VGRAGGERVAWRFNLGLNTKTRPADTLSHAPMTPFEVAGELLHAHVEGALWIGQQRTLVVSDLHLEKGSAYAAKGVFLPPYDTSATLKRLEKLIADLAPDRVVALGDSFHDIAAGSRMAGQDLDRLDAMASARAWTWIEGNHDPAPPAALPGERRESVRIGALTFRHEPWADAPPGEVAGHLHPCAKVAGGGRRVRRRCFVTDGARLILPAFGAYAGGLNVRDPAFAGLFPDGYTAMALGGAKVFALQRDRLLPD